MTSNATARWPASRARGFTLIELMISMVLGLVIVGSVMGVMLANKRTYSTTEGLSQVQESARTAYELLAHDIRQADGNGCGTSTGTANVLASTALWWQSWFGIRGFDSSQTDSAVAFGTGVGERVAGTDSIRVESMDGTGMSIGQHFPAAWRLDIPAAASDFVAGEIMLVCDFDHATIFQASSVTSAGGTVSVFHNNGVGTPGNCSQGLGIPTSCASVTGNTYTFPRNSQIGRLVATDWYIGNNGRAAEGGLSLFRRRLSVVANQPTVLTEEVVAGITDMEIQYRATGSDTIHPSAAPVPDWSVISTVLIRITAQSSAIGVTTNNALNSGRISKDYNYLVSLRNRLP
ncbi:MAG: prepilin-type N-terminal cleavage/methylation domain-containing protein [Steroidobacteraceae bacterium]